MNKIVMCPMLQTECLEDGKWNDEKKQMETCRFWIGLEGKNPNKPDETIQSHDCAFAVQPLMMINIANEVRRLSSDVQQLTKEERMIGSQITASILTALDAKEKLG
jgi:hypothetical protein